MGEKVNEEVDRISFHNYRPILTHIYAGPFLALYVLWAAFAVQVKVIFWAERNSFDGNQI